MIVVANKIAHPAAVDFGFCFKVVVAFTTISLKLIFTSYFVHFGAGFDSRIHIDTHGQVKMWCSKQAFTQTLGNYLYASEIPEHP